MKKRNRNIIIAVIVLIILFLSILFLNKKNNTKEILQAETITLEDNIKIDDISNSISEVSKIETNINDVVEQDIINTVEKQNIEENNNTEIINEEDISNIDVEEISYQGEKLPQETTNKDLMSIFPIVKNYVGTGYGVGANFRDDFDYTNYMIDDRHSLNDVNWWELTTYTASNGVVIKILPVEQGSPFPILDGVGADTEPNSPYNNAIDEILGREIERASDYVSFDIPITSYKKGYIDIENVDKNLYNYKKEYDLIYRTQAGRDTSLTTYYSFNMEIYRNSIQVIDVGGGSLWTFDYNGDYWQFRLNANVNELQWQAIRNVLRFLTPDAEQLYKVIREDWYYGSDVIKEYNEWFAVGNSYIYQVDTTNLGYGLYYFK